MEIMQIASGIRDMRIIACLVLIPWIVVWLRRRYFSPLSKYPGPWLASCTRLWKLFKFAHGRTHHDYLALHQKYGNIVRIGPNEVSFSSAESAAAILAPGQGFYKSDFYKVFPPPEHKDVFTEMNETVHAQKKRIVAPAYNLNSTIKSESSFDETNNLLLERLERFAHREETIDLAEWLHYYSFDTIGNIAFSSTFGFLEQGCDVGGSIKAINGLARYSGVIGQLPFLHDLLLGNPILRHLPLLASDGLAIIKTALDAIEKRKPFVNDKTSEKTDILHHLIASHLKLPDSFSAHDIFAVAFGAM